MRLFVNFDNMGGCIKNLPFSGGYEDQWIQNPYYWEAIEFILSQEKFYEIGKNAKN
jgi:hypothetical protein